jgi:protein-S-isoprenylcysteine O-methyltransferase Ste14
MWLEWFDIGDLLLAVAVLFTSLIVLFELLERRRENRRERTVLEAIEAEYRMYCRMGRL